MLALSAIAALAGTVTPHEKAQAVVRIVRVQRVDKQEWQRSSRRRELVTDDGKQRVTVRLVEFE